MSGLVLALACLIVAIIEISIINCCSPSPTPFSHPPCMGAPLTLPREHPDHIPVPLTLTPCPFWCLLHIPSIPSLQILTFPSLATASFHHPFTHHARLSSRHYSPPPPSSPVTHSSSLSLHYSHPCPSHHHSVPFQHLPKSRTTHSPLLTPLLSTTSEHNPHVHFTLAPQFSHS